jgi:hypothetical protein
MVSSPNSPLIDVLRAVREWYGTREAFWTHRADQAIQLRELRWRLAEVMVWLELHDGEEAASRLDAAVGELKEKWWDFESACEAAASHAEEEPRCREAAEVLLAAAGKLTTFDHDRLVEVGTKVRDLFAADCDAPERVRRG